MEVLRLFFMGFSYDEISAKTRVSKGSVVNIIKELKSGVYPEFDDVLDQIDALRTLAVDLKKGKTTITRAILGSTFINRFLDLGIEPEDVTAWIRLCRRLALPEYPLDQFMKTAVELMRLEEKTGLKSEELIHQYHGLTKQVSEKKEELTRVNSEIKKINKLLTQLSQTLLSQKKQMKAELQKILNQRNLTLKKIDYVSKLIPHELMKTGLDRKSVDQVIAGAKLCGGLANFTDLLEKEKVQLEGDIKELAQIRTTLEKRIEFRKYDLFLLNQKCYDTITRKDRAIRQMELGMQAIEKQVDDK
jgi:predicted  nucleic acid-binding Zn-ribbon protein